MLRFDGVLYGFTLWVNGKQVGEWASSYNPVTFDITDALLPGDPAGDIGEVRSIPKPQLFQCFVGIHRTL